MTGSASRLACTFRFRHPNAKRTTCGLPVIVESHGHAPLCLWHDPEARPDDFNVKQELERELQSPDHWLEGAKLAMEDLRGLEGREACLPSADLEGAQLDHAFLHKAILDDAVLISAEIPAATLSYASLVGTKLDGAHLTAADMTYCNLSGAHLDGTTFDRASLFGFKLSSDTVFVGVIWGIAGELLSQQFERAASVFRALRAHFRSISDLGEAEEFYYREMTALHLRAINAKFDANDTAFRRWWPARNWKWFGWALHRWVWGYGIRPGLTVFWMLFVVSFFGFVVFPWVGVQEGNEVSHSPLSGLALSAVTFATLGYGNRTPCGAIGELCGGLEAILGALLISVFVVGLATRNVHVN